MILSDTVCITRFLETKKKKKKINQTLFILFNNIKLFIYQNNLRSIHPVNLSIIVSRPFR
jgi:hypothetical protein